MTFGWPETEEWATRLTFTNTDALSVDLLGQHVKKLLDHRVTCTGDKAENDEDEEEGKEEEGKHRLTASSSSSSIVLSSSNSSPKDPSVRKSKEWMTTEHFSLKWNGSRYIVLINRSSIYATAEGGEMFPCNDIFNWPTLACPHHKAQTYVNTVHFWQWLNIIWDTPILSSSLL